MYYSSLLVARGLPKTNMGIYNTCPLFMAVVSALAISFLADLCRANPVTAAEPITDECAYLGLRRSTSYLPPCGIAKLTKGNDTYGCPNASIHPDSNEHTAECKESFCNTPAAMWFEPGTDNLLSRKQCCDGVRHCAIVCPPNKCTQFPEAECQVNPCGTQCSLLWIQKVTLTATATQPAVTKYVDVSSQCGGGSGASASLPIGALSAFG